MKVISFAKSGNKAVRPHYRLIGEISGGEVQVIELEEAEATLLSLKNERIFMESTHSHNLRGIIEKSKSLGNTFLHDNEEAVALFNSKWRTYIFLRENGFKQQETHLIEESALEFPFVVKSDDGNQGREVFLVGSEEELLAAKDKLKGKIAITQKFNPHAIGKDIRVVIFSNRNFFYQRNGGEGSFISNISSGGHASQIDALPKGFEDEIERLKKAVYSKMPALRDEYFAIDLFIEEDFNIIEMNYNPGIETLDKYHGQDFRDFFSGHLNGNSGQAETPPC